MCLTVYSVASFFFLCYWDCKSNAVLCCAVLCCAVLCCARPYSTVQVPDGNGIGVGNGVGDGTGPLILWSTELEEKPNTNQKHNATSICIQG
ncbi:hypothetical protein AO443_000499 [Nakaseomyces glabratus]|nr:hypothetical protein AO443_000499 [Nakaseomyces glabratus]